MYESLVAWNPSTDGAWDSVNAFDPVPPIATVYFGPATYHDDGFQLEVLSLAYSCYMACEANPECERFLIAKAARLSQEAFGNLTCELYRPGDSFTVDPADYMPGTCAQAQSCDTAPEGLGPDRCQCHWSCLTQDITDCCDDYISTCAMPNISQAVDGSSRPGARSGGLLADPSQPSATSRAVVDQQPAAGVQASIVVIAALTIVLVFVGAFAAFAARRRSRVARAARIEPMGDTSPGGGFNYGPVSARPALQAQTLFQDSA